MKYGLPDPPKPPKAPVKRLTLDEIDLQLNEIAQDADAGPDRFRALKMLRTAEGGAAILIDPINESEVVDRLVRIMRAPGSALCRIAYNRIYGQYGSKTKITDIPNLYEADDAALNADEREYCRKASVSLKVFNRYFPEAKRPGVPSGFPIKRGPSVISAFLYQYGVKAMLMRIEIRQAEGAKEAKDGEKAPD